MIRARSIILRSHRQFSTLLSKKPESLIIEDLTNPSINQEDEEGRIKLIESLLNSQNSNIPLLYNHLIPNFSYYFKIPKHSIKGEILRRLINVNPGRVHSTFDLYNLHRKEIDEHIINDVLKKLINEPVEEGEERNMENIFNIIKDFEHLEFDHVLSELFYKFVNQDDYKLINELINEGVLNNKNILKELTNDLSSIVKKFAYLEVFHRLFNTSRDEITADQYTIALNLLNFNNAQLHELFNKTNQLSFIQLTNEILEYIETSKIDELPDSIELRQSIIEVYGISQDNTEMALKKYHYYESHVKSDINKIRFEMIKLFSYQAIKQNSDIWNQVAQTFIPPQFTIETLQMLIVLKSYFNINEALEIYNSYINEVSGNINEISKKSPKGVMTESIILGFLLNNDREFAFLIFEKAVENKIMTDELEISQVKKMFKKYSDSFVDNEEWENNAQLKMKQVALEYIVNIGGIKY